MPTPQTVTGPAAWLLAPPIAFAIYLLLVGVLGAAGRKLAEPPQDEGDETGALGTSLYASGEAAPANRAAPGYAAFFAIALFFAVLHVGALILGTGGLSLVAIVYVGGLALALIAVMLG